MLVDYAHTPDALERVLVAARPLAAPGGAVVVVYGCGGDRDRAKRPLMGAAAARFADRAYLTSDNPRSEDPAAIIADVLAGVAADAAPPLVRPVVEIDRRRAIARAITEANAGDVVVIAGKGHETGQIVGERGPAVRRPHRRPGSLGDVAVRLTAAEIASARRRRSRRR